MPFELLGVYIWYFIAAILGFFVLKRARRKEIKGNTNVFVIGHRGAAGYFHENSLESFKKAISLGADYIETDVRLSLDGIFFLSHSDSVKTGKGKVKISESKADYLKSITLESGTKLMTLEGFVLEMPVNQGLCFDLKFRGHEFEFLSFLKKNKLVERSFITSHFAQSLRLLKVLEPQLIVGLSFPRDRFNPAVKILLSPIWSLCLFIIKFTYPFFVGVLASWARADFISVQFHIILSKSLIEMAHKKGLMVFAFNLKRERNIKKIIKWGVDGIISDYPDRVRNLIS